MVLLWVLVGWWWAVPAVPVVVGVHPFVGVALPGDGGMVCVWWPAVVVGWLSGGVMSDIDLSFAYRAAREGGRKISPRHVSPEDYPAAVAEAAITAALPHIERQVREQVAHEVAHEVALMRHRARDGRMPHGAERGGYLIALADVERRVAAGIARGEAR